MVLVAALTAIDSLQSKVWDCADGPQWKGDMQRFFAGTIVAAAVMSQGLPTTATANVGELPPTPFNVTNDGGPPSPALGAGLRELDRPFFCGAKPRSRRWPARPGRPFFCGAEPRSRRWPARPRPPFFCGAKPRSRRWPAWPRPPFFCGAKPRSRRWPASASTPIL